MTNLMQGLLDQMNRCREVLSEYERIPEGAIGAMLIKQDIANAEAAIASGDVVQMVRAYAAHENVK